MTARPDENLVIPIPVYVVQEAEQREDVGVIDLIRVVSQRKNVIFLSLLLSAALALAYLYMAEPAYHAETDLLPPHQRNIQELLIDLNGMVKHKVPEYSPALVFKSYLRNFNSKGVRREFFDMHNLSDVYSPSRAEGSTLNLDMLFNEGFNNALQVFGDQSEYSVVTVGFSYSSAELAAKWLNEFLEFVNERTAMQLVEDANTDIQLEIKRTKVRLEAMFSGAGQRRTDSVIELKEALRIANSLGITKANAAYLPAKEGGVAVNTAQLPLYMRGTKALLEEIEVLESRKSDEPFIIGYREMQEKLAFLEKIQLGGNSLTTVRIDQPAMVPYRKSHPRTVKIVALVVVFGLLVGVALVFLLELLLRAQAKPS